MVVDPKTGKQSTYHILEDGDVLTGLARVYVKRGNRNHVYQYENPAFAYRLWLGLDRGVLAAFRSAGDTTPVYSHDYVDRM